ncbi:AAA family ATPase [Chloroflexi bacterium TSY]|nr:AAA family ATPase [Chloroflexi bacterium TSY]
MAQKPPVYRIVLTGGPCGGKTTALSHLSERISALGYNVYLVPEVPTMLFEGGITLDNLTPLQRVSLSDKMLTLIQNLEDSFMEMAQLDGKPAVVICDRGVMDVQAYLPANDWEMLLDEHRWRDRWREEDISERRYDAVIHMMTAAEGAEEFYTLSGNEARYETPDEARAVDLRLRDAWKNHPQLTVIDNSTSFEQKIRRVVATVCQVLDIPEPVEIERKFLVKVDMTDGLPVEHDELELVQLYLHTADGSESRLRRRRQDDNFTYVHTIKRPLEHGERVEIERIVSRDEYYKTLMPTADRSRRIIKKQRHVFNWNGLNYDLDTFIDPHPELQLLEVGANKDETIEMPPFVQVEREVTDDERYYNAAIAAGSLDGIA